MLWCQGLHRAAYKWLEENSLSPSGKKETPILLHEPEEKQTEFLNFELLQHSTNSVMQVQVQRSIRHTTFPSVISFKRHSQMVFTFFEKKEKRLLTL